jgi:four helix bundle protein
MMNDERGEVRKENLRGNDLRTRTSQFALRVIRMYVALKKNDVAMVLGRQLLRSATSVGAHYREASRARSVAEFISKLEVAVGELDESVYWLELLAEAKIVTKERLEPLTTEAIELTRILVASIKTAKSNRRT